MVETDKVNVEVRSPAAGTITAFFAGPDDNVLVGADLLEIDVGVGEAGATSAPSAATFAAAAATTPAPAAAPIPAKTPSKLPPAPPFVAAAPSARIHPSGKPSLISFPPRGAAAIAAAAAAKAAAAPTMAVMPSRFADEKPSPPGTIAFAELPARFRRKRLEEDEMEAIMTGGADYTW